MRIQHINIQRIKKPFSYCYHYELKDTILLTSIKDQGILNPIWLVRKNGLLVIDGHRRWRAAKSIGLTKIPVYLHSRSELSRSFISALYLNLTTGKLSMVEKLKILYLSWHLFDENTFRKASQILELSNVPNIFEISFKIISSPRWLQEYVHQANMSLKFIEKIVLYPLNRYRKWLEMAALLQLNGIELIQLLQSVHDISVRDRIEVDRLWQLLKIDVFLSSDFTLSQKIQHIKKTIDERRFPILHQINKNILEEISSFPKSFKNMFQISWDRNLEQPGIQISFRMKLLDDLRIACKIISNKDVQPKLDHLVKQITNSFQY
jgi:ParB/RepB/Spo0J family partition protein